MKLPGVEVPDSPSLNPGAAGINITLWVNTSSLPTSGDYDLVRKGAYPGQEYKVELLPHRRPAPDRGAPGR